MFIILISLTRNQRMPVLYLHVFCDSIFSLEIFSTTLTLICFNCLLHMKKHLYEAILVTFVERSLRLNGTWKNISKKFSYIILVSSQRYQDFRQLLQNPKVPKIVLGFSNHAQRFTPPYYLDVDNPLWISCSVGLLPQKYLKMLLGTCMTTWLSLFHWFSCVFHGGRSANTHYQFTPFM